MRHGHPHPRLQQRLSRRHELWVYGTGAVLSLSGIGWLICHYLLPTPTAGPHPLEVWWLRLHGAAVVGFLITLGTLLPAHVVYGWRHRMNRGSGIPMLAAAALLGLSGYGLYYLVDDRLRSWTSTLHWIVGLAATALLALHSLLGKRGARARSHPERHTSQPRHSSHHPGHRPPP